MPLHKNWSAICKIDNPLFRLAVSMMDEPEQLAKLAVGFPELFSAEPQPHGPFPVSMIRDRQERYSLKEWGGEAAEIDRNLNWREALAELHIPEISFGDVDDAGLVPNDIINQLMGQPICCGMKVSYKGVHSIVTTCNVSWKFGKEFGEAELNVVYLGISPASFFDWQAPQILDSFVYSMN